MIKEEKRILEAASENQTQRTSDTVTKRIGSTVYRLKICFSTEAKETMEDKILRMVKNETARIVVA